jgi:hypothetical protein
LVMLRAESVWTRLYFLPVLTKQAPILLALGDDEAIEVVQAILDVRRWWPSE